MLLEMNFRVQKIDDRDPKGDKDAKNENWWPSSFLLGITFKQTNANCKYSKNIEEFPHIFTNIS